jgi:hypothetical protein
VSSVSSPVPPAGSPAPAGEAKRSTLASLAGQPGLRPQLARLREHFGADARGPFALQRAELAEGRIALLVARADESDPILFAVDPVTGDVLFTKERPTAGIASPTLHTTLAPAPERGVAVFTYVASMHIVAARMWADDANPFADVEVFRPSSCDALSVAYERTAGWIVACASTTGTLAGRLRSDLTSAWPSDGLPIGTPSPVDRARITFDGPLRFTLTQRAKAVGGDRQLTFHYDIDGQALQ